jgi:hypothetical protein
VSDFVGDAGAVRDRAVGGATLLGDRVNPAHPKEGRDEALDGAASVDSGEEGVLLCLGLPGHGALLKQLGYLLVAIARRAQDLLGVLAEPWAG